MSVKVIGSMTDHPIFDKTRHNLMTRDIVEEQMQELQRLVRAKIATFSDTGELWESVKTRGPYRSGPHAYSGEVYSELEYAAAVEYGWSPRKVEPKRAKALRWGDATGINFSNGHYIGGFSGHHMFAKSSAEMDRGVAEDIAEDKVRLWLGPVDAGKRSVVF